MQAESRPKVLNYLLQKVEIKKKFLAANFKYTGLYSI